MAAAAVGAVGGTIAGSIWRDYYAGRFMDWQGALLEDAASLARTLAAFKR